MRLARVLFGLTIVVLSNDTDFEPGRVAKEIARIYRDP